MTSSNRKISAAELVALKHKYNHWGRWGSHDELGAPNLITPEIVLAAVHLVRRGAVFSLAHPIGKSGPPQAWPPRFPPIFTVTRSGDDIRRAYDSGQRGSNFTDDMITMPLQTATHWDALSHAFYDAQMYNGGSPDDIRTQGAQRSAITVARAKMVGRGVLLDVPRLTGRDYLEIGEAIEAEDVLACCERQGVQIGTGDIVLVRTGRLGLAARTGEWGEEWAAGPNTGLGISAVDLLASRDVAAVAADNFSVEIIPAQTDAAEWTTAPAHAILMQSAGIYLGEFWALDELAADCAADSVYEFLLIAAPLAVDGAVGAACNPQAIK